MPTPNKNEKRSEFISRCMGDGEMNTKFPNRAQRLAVCAVYWRDRDKK